MMPRQSAHMTVMIAAAQKAAKRLLRDFNEVEQLQVSVKGPSDFVSQADLRSEQTIREELTRARPGYALLMEESGASGSEKWAWRWVVDPLDGTTNFLHGIPNWAISIALEKRLPDGGSEVAAGRYDGFWELGLYPWDMAAGALMVREAGGYATAPDGTEALEREVVAGNPHLQPRLREMVAEALGGPA